MKIVVNNIAAASGGALTVLKDFYNCVKENDRENQWIFLLGDNLIEETDNIKVIALPKIKQSRLKKLWFDFVSGKRFIKSLEPDVVFSMQNIITFGLKTPQILYVHQSVPFQNSRKFSFLKGSERGLAVYQYLIGAIIKKSAKKAARVIVQTDWMKKAVAEKCRISPEKIYKITPDVNDLSAYKTDDGYDSKSFFYPTSEVIYKNNSAIFKASEILNAQNLEHSVTLTLPGEQSNKNINCIGRIPYEEVIEHYKKSTLIFPSYIETFGYPLAEARALGSIVLASDCPFSRELLAGYENAYFFNPFAPNELAELMKKVITGEIVRKETSNIQLKEIGSWQKVITAVTNSRILFLTNVPSPYRVDFFNELGKICDLTVLFEKGASDERDKSWKNYSFESFNGIVLGGKSTDTDKAFSLKVTKYLKAHRWDKIIIANTATPTGMLAIEYLGFKKIPYYIEGDGGFAKSGKGLKEAVKRHFVKGAKGYFSTSAAHDEYYLTYGASKELIHRYPFTSLKSEDIINAPVSCEEKTALREKLGIKENKAVISVGQMIHRKGFDVLINAAKNLKDDIGVYIVGGKPTEEYLSLTESLGLTNIHFIDFMLKPQLKEYYKACDLFVLPTREDIWGLVINEAMAAGLPVITTDRCIAGLELINDNENGFIIPTDNHEILAERINTILYDDALQKAMCEKSIEKIRGYTVSTMAKAHLDILNK